MELPLLGLVSAGQPVVAVEERETLTAQPYDILRRTLETFIPGA
ncbi:MULTISPECIES: hypothetical protein [unclassified Thiocapsa]